MKNIITSVRGPTKTKEIVFVIMEDSNTRSFVNFSSLLDAPGRSYIEFVDIFSYFENYTRSKVEIINIADKAYIILSKAAYIEFIEASDTFSLNFNKKRIDAVTVPDQFSRLSEFNRTFNDSSRAVDRIVIAKGKVFYDDFEFGDISVNRVFKPFRENYFISEDNIFSITKPLRERVVWRDLLTFEAGKILRDINSPITDDIPLLTFTKRPIDSFENLETHKFNISKPLVNDIESIEQIALTPQKPFFDFSNITERLLKSNIKVLQDNPEILDVSISSVDKYKEDSVDNLDYGDVFHYTYTLNNTYFAERYVGIEHTF